MTDKTGMLVQRACAWLVVVMLVLAGLYGAGWVAWEVMLAVPPDAARVWALVATVLLFPSVFVTWRLALRYATGVVDGIGMGVKEVAKAGSNAADLRVHVHREMRRRPSGQVVVLPELPEVEVVHRRLAASGDVVEL